MATWRHCSGWLARQLADHPLFGLWWRTLHQGQSITTQGSSIAPELLWPLPLTMFGFTAIFAAVVLMRMRAELARQKLEARLRRSMAE